MKVWMAAADRGSCGYWRMRLPMEVLKDEVEFVEVETLRARYLDDDTLSVDPPDCDVAVFQRPLRGQALELIESLQRAGTAVVVELDDDLRHVHPDNHAYKAMMGGVDDMHWCNVEWAAEIADLVTVTTPALAERYGSHGRVAVLPNYVPEILLEIEVEREERQVVGWTGTTAVHPDDLVQTYGGVAAACEEAGAVFRVVGDATDANEMLGLRIVEQTGMVEQELFHAEVARFDAGVVPLSLSKFNAAKSWLKGLEYAALGIPFVASPTPEYQRLREMGIGHLAGPSWAEWREGVLSSLTPHAREAAKRGREVVREHLTFEGNAHLWPEAWERAITNRKQVPVAQL